MRIDDYINDYFDGSMMLMISEDYVVIIMLYESIWNSWAEIFEVQSLLKGKNILYKMNLVNFRPFEGYYFWSV